MKTTVLRLIAFAILAEVTCISNCINAQIKVVGDDYSSNLTGAKSYYDQDVDFDRFFPPVSEIALRPLTPSLFTQEIRGISSRKVTEVYSKLNLVGDTFYLINNIYIMSGNDVFYPTFCVNRWGQVVSDTMYAGYYEVIGYVFCTDNEDSIRSAFGKPFDEHQYYGKDRRDDGNSSTRREEREKQLSKYSMLKIKEEILRGKEVKIWDFVRYMVFRAIDADSKSDTNARVFYLAPNDHSRSSRGWQKKLVPLRFYNQTQSFVGQKVVVTNGGWGHNYDEDKDEWRLMSKYHNMLRDPISNTLIKIEDNVFTVKDIVMKDKDFYAILEGEKTGSFALSLKFILDVQNRNDLDYTWWNNNLENGNWDKRDIPCFFCAPENRDDYYTIVIKDDDLKTLDRRAKIAAAIQEKEWKQKELQEKQENARREAALKQQMIAKYGSKYGELVGKKQVAIGMSKEMCRDAWGRPLNKYTTTTRFGESEVWCYNYKTRVYFFDGKVVQIDD